MTILRIWPNAQHLVNCARAFGQMLKIFGQMRSAIGQMRAHLTNCVHIWSLSVGLTKCAAHLGKRAAQLAKCARNLPNVAHLVKCRAFDQLVKCAAHLAKCADWSNAPYNRTQITHQNKNVRVGPANLLNFNDGMSFDAFWASVT